MTDAAPGSARQPTAAVIGASFAGLLAATAAAQAGYQVTILERDRLPTRPAPRAGVPQSVHAHVLLRRGLLAIESLLPGVEAELLRQGGVPFYTSQMPWLGEYGWMPQTNWSYEVISISRPLLEFVVRTRVLEQTGIRLQEGTRVNGLSRTPAGWQVRCHDNKAIPADLVIDASGRTSRLPHWLADLGITAPERDVIDAKLGYATRRYRGSLPLASGMAVLPTPATLTGAMLLPIEENRWLAGTIGYGERRPGRDVDGFDAFLSGLRDPAIADAVRLLEPDGDVVIHRQTANCRYDYGSARDWPAGLIVVGDSLCAFNPAFGQGITVAASQAELLVSELRRPLADSPRTRRVQRQVSALVQLPWSVTTGEDLRMPTSVAGLTRSQRLAARWTTRMLHLAASGDEACSRAFSQVYHLMGSPALLFSPRVVAAILRSLGRPLPPPAERPPVLAALTPAGSAHA